MQRIEINVVSGECEVIELTAEEIAEVHARVNSPETLKVRRDARIADVKELRDRIRYEGGVKVGDRWFLSTRDAVAEYSALFAIAQSNGLPSEYVLRPAWRTMEPGVTMDMTPALVSSILLTGLAKVSAIDDRSEALIAQIKASQNPEAIDITGGWPAVFVET